ncbi:MAG: tetratricopeptide repeat protein [Mariniblastus sp.]
MSKFSSLLIAVIIAVCSVPYSASEAIAQQVGDRVVVTANSETKIYKKVVGLAYEGSIRTVDAVNGKWCSLDDDPGWLLLQNVMDMNMAMKHFSKRIKDSDRDYIALAHRGMIYHDLEQWGLAFNDLNESLKVNAKNPVTWMHRGMVLKAQGKYILAAKDIRKAIELNPKLANAHYNIGLVFYALNDYEQALKAYDNAIKLNKNHALWYISRGSAKLGTDDLDGAKADYLHALSIKEARTDSEAHAGLSNIALIQEDLDEAFKQANMAVEAQPKNAMALNARGWVRFKQGNTDEAIYDLSRAIRYAPSLSIAYGNRGVCYVSQNEFDNAIADHTKHTQLDPKSPFALANRGVAWLGKGEFAKAKADFEASEKMAPELDETLNGHAWFLATCPDEKYRDGKAAVEKAKLACENSKEKDWYHLDTLAAAYAELGKFDEAIKWAKKAVEVAPESKKKICEEQLARFERKEPFRSTVGKNAEQGIISGPG